MNDKTDATAGKLSDNEFNLAWEAGVEQYQSLTSPDKQNDWDRFRLCAEFVRDAQLVKCQQMTGGGPTHSAKSTSN